MLGQKVNVESNVNIRMEYLYATPLTGRADYQSISLVIFDELMMHLSEREQVQRGQLHDVEQCLKLVVDFFGFSCLLKKAVHWLLVPSLTFRSAT